MGATPTSCAQAFHSRCWDSVSREALGRREGFGAFVELAGGGRVAVGDGQSTSAAAARSAVRPTGRVIRRTTVGISAIRSVNWLGIAADARPTAAEPRILRSG